MMKLSQAIAITFFLYLIMEMDKLISVPTPLSVTSQQSIGLKLIPQPTADLLKPKL